MNKNRQRIIAIFLLVAFGLWILFTVLPMGGNSGGGKKGKTKLPKIVEPQFTKEASLAILDSNGRDTLKVLDIELAETIAEIQYGMMYRRSMEEHTGMLFLMGEERRQSFYMKNTYVSLDIIYINDAMQVVSIQKNAQPLNESSLPSEGPASLVLEIKGGLSDRWGIEKGQKIRWKRLD